MGSIPIISTRSAVPTATLDKPNANITPENESCANKRKARAERFERTRYTENLHGLIAQVVRARA